MFRTKYLRWFRDQGKGQEASDYFKADEWMDGTWPVASIAFDTEQEREHIWNHLYKAFKVNALATYENWEPVEYPVQVNE